ncbi:hypothetical protein [Butyrivibrio sp.]|uniref:hypothetical protein n=1 Tax=Butyrivibrio sp. TaxID=28121 RepID=UPI0025C0EB90|nr:hypothetical protein [Butyrivibrio sp.]MBQ9303239.1 hypothetical protein [Butyrivibrio sp.]
MSNDNLGPWSAFNNESTEEAESQEKQFHVDSVNSNASSNKGNTQNINWLKVFAPSIVFLLLEMIGTMNLLGVWISLLLSVVVL